MLDVAINLSLSKNDLISYNDDSFKNHLRKADVKHILEKSMHPNGIIDGDKLKQKWFPTHDYEVFISHSHNDLDIAKRVANFLAKEIGLKSFVDSDIWGSADDLLKEIDNRYCKIPNSRSYRYKKRNLSASHVYLLLSSAIMEVMNSAACVIFINSPNSISHIEAIDDETLSPWISFEISLANMLLLQRQAIVEGADFNMARKMDLQNFKNMNLAGLLKWKQNIENQKNGYGNNGNLFMTTQEILSQLPKPLTSPISARNLMDPLFS